MCLPVWRELKQNYYANRQNIVSPVWMCLPVWRELKRKFGDFSRTIAARVWMCLPVWRELKHKIRLERRGESMCLNVPSRLKGIETCVWGEHFHLKFFKSECAFPFEGNWNFVSRSGKFVIHCCLNVPSRLKGIETWTLCTNQLCYVPRLNVPSRLKGIETYGNSDCDWIRVYVWMCLPVWRELKLHLARVSTYKIGIVWMCLPVWRELKLLECINHVFEWLVWMCLPVWRELKL